jgi:hypothetical protein
VVPYFGLLDRTHHTERPQLGNGFPFDIPHFSGYCSLANEGCPTSRSFFARCGIPPTQIGECIGRIESQKERAAVSHISQKTSEMWATRHERANKSHVEGLGLKTAISDSTGIALSY